MPRRAPPSQAPGQISAGRFAFAFLLVACIFLWPLILNPGWMPARSDDQESDLSLTHLPNAAYVREALARYGQWPLWNAQILAGQPFAADPLSGLWYPPNLLLIIPWLNLPLAFNLLFVVHLAWAGSGVFQLLTAEGLPVGPAFFGGVAFAGTPKLMAHLGAGHVSLFFAVAWTPWLLLAIRRALAHGQARLAALTGALLALIFLADVRWAFYAALLGLAYGLAVWRQRPESAHLTWPDLRVLLKSGLVAGGFFLALSAILLVPLFEFLQYSSRTQLTLGEAGAYSLPPFPYLLGLIIPLYGVIHEWVVYVGLVPLVLALVGLRQRPFWALAALVAGAFSLGTNFVLYPILFRWLPGINLLRVPTRAWFIVSLALCLLAAHGLSYLSVRWFPRLTPSRFLPLWLPALLLTTSVDLLWMNHSLLIARPLPAPSAAAEWLAAQPGLFRVYSSSASLPLPDRLQHVEGVDPLHLTALADFVARATSITTLGYSVSVPAVFSPDGQTTPPPNARLLGLLNVRYVASAFDLSVPGLTLVRQFGATRVYENEAVRPRAWLGEAAVEVVAWSPDRLELKAQGPGLVVLSEIAYPGWQARAAGNAAPIETVDGLLRGVRLGPGAQSVVLEYRPWSVYTGALLTLLGTGALVALWLRKG